VFRVAFAGPPGSRIELSQQFMLASLASGRIDHGSDAVRPLPAPKELKFELNGTSKGHIVQAERDFDDLVGKHELLVSRLCGLHPNLPLTAVST
jgi:carnitine O-acetyltransferase